MYIDEREIIREELNDNEHLVWASRPIVRVMTTSGLILSVFGSFFIIFSIIWISTLLRDAREYAFFRPTLMDKIFPYIGVIPLLIGIALLLSPIWLFLSSKKVIYAITNQRCIIFKIGRTKKVTSYIKDDIKVVNKIERRNGTGDVLFAKEAYHNSNDSGTSNISYRNVGFYSVDNVREVERHIRELISK